MSMKCLLIFTTFYVFFMIEDLARFRFVLRQFLKFSESKKSSKKSSRETKFCNSKIYSPTRSNNTYPF